MRRKGREMQAKGDRGLRLVQSQKGEVQHDAERPGHLEALPAKAYGRRSVPLPAPRLEGKGKATGAGSRGGPAG